MYGGTAVSSFSSMLLLPFFFKQKCVRQKPLGFRLPQMRHVNRNNHLLETGNVTPCAVFLTPETQR